MLIEATAPPCDKLLRAVDGLSAPPPGALNRLRTSLSPLGATRIGPDPRAFDFVDAAKHALPVIGALPPPPKKLALQFCETVLATGIASVLTEPRGPHDRCASARFAAGVLRRLGEIVLAGFAPKSMARAARLAHQTGMDRMAAQRTLLGVDEVEICRRLADAWGLEWFEPYRGDQAVTRRQHLTACGDAGRYISDPSISDHVRHANERVLQRMDEIRATLDLAEFARRWSAGGLNWDDAQTDLSAIEAGHSAFINRDFAQALAEHLDNLPPYANAARCCRSSAAWFRGATDSVAAVCAIRSRGGLVAATDRLILAPRPADRIEAAHPRCEWIARILADTTFVPGVTQAPARIGQRILANAGIRLESPVWLLRFGDGRGLTGLVALAEPSRRAMESVTRQSQVVIALLQRTYESVTVLRATRRSANSAAGQAGRQPDHIERPLGSASEILSRLAAGAAHELNNPLAVISGRAQMLLFNAGDGDEARALRTIHEQARRASGMVNELIEAAKPPDPDAEPILLGDWVERMRQYWRGLSGDRIGSFEARLADPGVRIWADPDQLDVVSREILDNARLYAKSENVHVTINSTSSRSDETIVLSVRDDGQGMTPQAAAHACDPFYSQREAGRGRGLGLTRAIRLVEVNGGRMWIESRHGIGTTVHIALASTASRPSKLHRNP